MKVHLVNAVVFGCVLVLSVLLNMGLIQKAADSSELNKAQTNAIVQLRQQVAALAQAANKPVAPPEEETPAVTVVREEEE